MKSTLYLSLIVFVFLYLASCSNNIDCQDETHPHLVDLGLPNGTMWACCNVGANSCEDIGGYYAWGETSVKSIYDEIHYQHNEVSNRIPQRMRNIAGSKFDVASVRMGSMWTIPTSEQWNELIDYCKWEWVKCRGRQGWKITGPNGNQIFLPAGGMKGGNDCYSKDDHGYYLTSDYDPSDDSPYQFFTNGGCREIRSSGGYRAYGHNVRAVGK